MKHPDEPGNCAVLIVSCDKYKDLWGPCITLLRRFWTNCPYSIYLLSNTEAADFPNVASIMTGSDISWSHNLRIALEHIREPYVLLYVEDLFLTKEVQSSVVESLIERCVSEHWNYVRLNPTPKGDRRIDNAVSRISPGAVYRSSVVFSVWNKDVLNSLLLDGESAWDFEEIGSKRTDKLDGFYASNHTLIHASNTVIKGVWEVEALNIVRKLGIEPDIHSRRVMTNKEYALWKLKQLRSLLFHLLPHGTKRKVKGFFRQKT
ncbi:MAG: hypothetical protein ACKO5I_07560 [Ignavibacteria bacterium]